jgi:hypothetical protein
MTVRSPSFWKAEIEIGRRNAEVGKKEWFEVGRRNAACEVLSRAEVGIR